MTVEEIEKKIAQCKHCVEIASTEELRETLRGYIIEWERELYFAKILSK